MECLKHVIVDFSAYILWRIPTMGNGVEFYMHVWVLR